MEKKKNSGNKSIGAIVGFVICLAMGVLWGACFGWLLSDVPEDQSLLFCAVSFLAICVGSVIHIVIHEAGHLVFGLLSGYRFSSFRILNFMWIKEGDRITLKRYSIAGTGGQCLMVPPEPLDGKIPVVLYNFGGSIMNILVASLFLGLYFLFSESPLVAGVMLEMAMLGFVLGLSNGIPISTSTINNDGHNALSLEKDAAACRGFYIQLKVSEQLSRGVRMKDMPEEWFEVPSDEAMKNSMVAAMGVFAANRMLDGQEFEKAHALIKHLLEIDSGMAGIHRNGLICDRIYLDIISEDHGSAVIAMEDAAQKKFMKAMKNHPSVMRTDYTYTLLCRRDPLRAAQIRGGFEKLAKTYPYPQEIQGERELMDAAYRWAQYYGLVN